MYRELIEKLIEGHSWAKLQAPCSEKDITKAEKFVGFSFPEELKALFAMCIKLMMKYGLEFMLVAQKIHHLRLHLQIWN